MYVHRPIDKTGGKPDQDTKLQPCCAPCVCIYQAVADKDKTSVIRGGTVFLGNKAEEPFLCLVISAE